MGVLSDKPQDIGIESKTAAERDMIELNHEIAGVENGRIKRFLNEGSLSFSGETKKEKAAREFRTMLDMLLAEDPIYAALYKQVAEKIEKAQQAVDLALVDINQRLEASGRKLQLLRDNAAELPDRTKVFQSTDGSIYTEQGKRISDEKARSIIFPDSAPSWEIFKAEKETYGTAARQKEAVDIYQKTVLDPTTKRMNDEDDPPSKDELKGLNDRIDNKMPDFIKQDFKIKDAANNKVEISSISNAHGQVEKTNLKVPDMGKSFDLARTDIPDLGNALDTKPAPVKTIARNY